MLTEGKVQRMRPRNERSDLHRTSISLSLFFRLKTTVEEGTKRVQEPGTVDGHKNAVFSSYNRIVVQLTEVSCETHTHEIWASSMQTKSQYGAGRWA